jgi:uncharacterized protein YcbK (DUF882 family)
VIHLARRFAFSRIARLGAVAVALVAGCFALGASPASAETRTLDLYYVHTGERAQITFKKNGRYDAAGLKKLNQMLRDWRRNEPTRMDPLLFDLVWEVWKESGSRKPITVTSAYRSPATNSMLRRRSRGVAKNSQHTYGRAMDWFVTDVPTSKLRAIALRKQVGGVGFYPTSRTPFIHTDTGTVRHWPRMTRSQLVAVFPKGRTLHVPTDGKPLPGYEEAVNDYMRRKKGLSVASSSGSDGAAGATAGFGRGGGIIRPPPGASKNVLAMLFGGGVDEEEDTVDSSGAIGGGGDEEDAPAPARATTPARATEIARAPTNNARATPSDSALPGVDVEPAPAAATRATPRTPEPPAVVSAPPPPAPPAPAAAPEPTPASDPVGALLVAANTLPPRAKPDAPAPAEPAAAEPAVPEPAVAATVVAGLRVPVPAPGREAGTVAVAVASTAPPRPKPAEFLVAAATLTAGTTPPVLGYATAGPASLTGDPVDVFAETAATVMRDSRPPAAMRGSATASRSAGDDAMPGASDLGIAPMPGLVAVAVVDPFADELTAPDRSEPLLLSQVVTVRAMDFAKLSAPDGRSLPEIIATVDLPGTDGLYAGIVPGPRTDRFTPDTGDTLITVALR